MSSPAEGPAPPPISNISVVKVLISGYVSFVPLCCPLFLCLSCFRATSHSSASTIVRGAAALKAGTLFLLLLLALVALFHASRGQCYLTCKLRC